MQKISDKDSQISHAAEAGALYFTVGYNGRLLDYSDETGLWMREALGLSLNSFQGDKNDTRLQNFYAGTLFQDPSQASRAIKQVIECGQAFEGNAVLKQKDKTFCLAALFATTARKQGENGSDAVLFIVRPICPTSSAGRSGSKDSSIPATDYESDAILLDSQRRKIWDKVWSNNFNIAGLRSPVNESLRLLGEYLNVDRLYILNKKAEDVPLKMDFEWCAAGVPRLIDLNISSPDDKKCPADFLNIIRRTEPSYIHPTSELTAQAANAFEARGVKSLLVTPYCRSQIYCMYVVAESSNAMLQWSREDQLFIHELSMLLASVIAYKRSEITKKGSEHALETLLSYLESSIFLLRRNNAEVIFANRVFMGFMSDDVVGKNCLDRNEQDLGAIFLALSKNEQQQHWTPGDGKLRFECFLPAQYRWMLIECQLMTLNDDDGYLLCSALDITSRKEEEERLRRLSLTDPVSGAFYMQVGMKNLEVALDELVDSQAHLSLACISLDNYHRLHSDAGSERAEEILNFLVRTVQQEYSEHQVTRLSLNEIMLCMPYTGIEECRQRFLALPHSLLSKRDESYSLYELAISLGFAESHELKRKNAVALLLEARQDLHRAQNNNVPSVLPIIL